MIPFGKNKLIMTDEKDEVSFQQCLEIADSFAFKNARIRVMPDYHAGKGSVIGFTAYFDDYIVPNVVGVDIGCGVSTYNLGPISFSDLPALDRAIRKAVPMGFAHHKNDKVFKKYFREGVISKWMKNAIDPVNANAEICPVGVELYGKRLPTIEFGDPRLQLGTLGGGNHFIELGEHDGNKYLSVHCGSRNFGLKIASGFQTIAKNFCKYVGAKPTKDLEYLTMQHGGHDYLFWMDVAQKFAALNREIIIREILNIAGGWCLPFNEDRLIESTHNFIEVEKKIIRKGAIAAYPGETVVIPLSPSKGTAICTPKDKESLLYKWNFSLPHGAGRKLGRNQAKKTLNIKKYKEDMEGIYSSSVTKGTLDEAPAAYKDPDTILDLIEEIVDIDGVIKPIMSIKDK